MVITPSLDASDSCRSLLADARLPALVGCQGRRAGPAVPFASSGGARSGAGLMSFYGPVPTSRRTAASLELSLPARFRLRCLPVRREVGRQIVPAICPTSCCGLPAVGRSHSGPAGHAAFRRLALPRKAAQPDPAQSGLDWAVWWLTRPARLGPTRLGAPSGAPPVYRTPLWAGVAFPERVGRGGLFGRHEILIRVLGTLASGDEPGGRGRTFFRLSCDLFQSGAARLTHVWTLCTALQLYLLNEAGAGQSPELLIPGWDGYHL